MALGNSPPQVILKLAGEGAKGQRARTRSLALPLSNT